MSKKINTDGLEKITDTTFLVLKIKTYEIWADSKCYTVGRIEKGKDRSKGLAQPAYYTTLSSAIKHFSDLTLKQRLKRRDGPDEEKTLKSMVTTIQEHDLWLREMIGEH